MFIFLFTILSLFPISFNFIFMFLINFKKSFDLLLISAIFILTLVLIHFALSAYFKVL